MQVNQDSSTEDSVISESGDGQSTKVIDKQEEKLINKENEKSDQTFFDIIKSRPKRPNRKVPSRLQSPLVKSNIVIEATNGSESKPNQTTINSNTTLDVGLDTFFQSSSMVFKRSSFADVYPADEIVPSSRSTIKATIKSNLTDKNDKNNNSEEVNNNTSTNKLCPLSMADKIARSRSSPNLIDPRKMLLPGDPRHNLNMIKELRSRQKSGESTENSHTNNNNNSNHSSLLSELKAKNKPFCPKKEVPSLVPKEKPPILHLKPSLKPIAPKSSGSSSVASSSSSSSTSSSVQQSSQFFNVKLRETKSTKGNNLVKSYTRASFPVSSESHSDEKMKRNSEPSGNPPEQHDNSGDGKDGERLSKEASADEKKKNHRSSGDSSSSPSSSDDEDERKKEDNEEDNCHQNGTKSEGGISC